MKLIDNKVEEYIQEPGLEGIYKAVRDAAAICYQTDVDKMKLSPKEFIDNVIIKNGHTRCLEFGTVYLIIKAEDIPLRDWYEKKDNQKWGYDIIERYRNNSYSKVNFIRDTDYFCITTNFRVIMQGYYTTDKEAFDNGYNKNWLKDLEYLCKPTEHHYKRRTFTMLMSRGCTDDMRTHISLSSICESTRFCNYSKDKYGNELTWIKPYWISQETVDAYMGNLSNRIKFLYKNPDTRKDMIFLTSMNVEEGIYLKMAKYKLQPQQLKRLFPLGVKAELRLCGYDEDWNNLFWRRCDDHADPECHIVAKKIEELYNK